MVSQALISKIHSYLCFRPIRKVIVTSLYNNVNNRTNGLPNEYELNISRHVQLQFAKKSLVLVNSILRSHVDLFERKATWPY